LRQCQEFLVVRISATGQGDGGNGLPLCLHDRAAADLGQMPVLPRFIQSEFGIGEDGNQFVEAGSIDHDPDSSLALCRLDRCNCRIVEQQPVDPNVGVEHQPHGYLQNLS